MSHLLCLTGDEEECRRLLDAGVDMYSEGADNKQALHLAVAGDKYVRTGVMGVQFRDSLKHL